ncbi:hypothetical protein V6N11_068320 [Hibiscus sabdariffa]|uniref:Uncharacterized protein n=2 Tax=Hibiscus sabdariffa TaxID=183260 RepID=A0ABR2B677_9ROSI
MEVYGKTMAAAPANVIYLSTILGRDGPIPVHKCDWKCQNEHVCGNMYRCKLTGLTHICDKNCNQRILYDNHSSLCRASGQVFPLTQAEEQAVRGVRRKLDADNSSPSDSCGFKRRRDAQFHPSPFERSFAAGLLVDCKVVQPYSFQTHCCHLQTATSFGGENKPIWRVSFCVAGCEHDLQTENGVLVAFGLY